jgi:hypothetical protein
MHVCPRSRGGGGPNYRNYLPMAQVCELGIILGTLMRRLSNKGVRTLFNGTVENRLYSTHIYRNNNLCDNRSNVQAASKIIPS